MQEQGLTYHQGHYAVLFAKALGAQVYVFSHSANKESDVKEMGADHFVLTEKGFQEKYAMELNLIISTVNSVEGMHLEEYLS